MSLLLRQTGDTTLAVHDLQAFHIGIDNESKQLKLVNNNGDQLLSLKGIRFSSMNPTKNEIKLALELLDGFLIKHWLMIKAYLDKHTAFTQRPVINDENQNFSIDEPHRGNDSQYHVNKLEKRFICTYKDALFEWTFFVDNDLNFTFKQMELLNSFENKTTPEDLTNYHFDQNAFENGHRYIADYISYTNERASLEKSKQKLFKYDV